MPEILILFVAGLIGGFIAGLIGIGGSPAYILVYQEAYLKLLPPGSGSDVVVRVIIANSVFSIMVAGLAGTWQQWRKKNLFPSETFLIGIPAALSAVGVTWLLTLTEWYTVDKFSIFFSILLLPLLVKMFFSKNREEAENGQHQAAPLHYVITGLASGCATALSGIGGGFVVIPVLNGLLRVPVRKTMSVSMGTIALTGLGLTAYNLILSGEHAGLFPYAAGYICFPVVLPVIAGVLLAAPAGVLAARRLSAAALKTIFLLFSLAAIGRMLFNLTQ